MVQGGDGGLGTQGREERAICHGGTKLTRVTKGQVDQNARFDRPKKC